MFLGMRPRADTLDAFCRAQSRTAWTWSRPDHRRLHNSVRSAGLLRRDTGAVVHVLRQLSPQPGCIRRAEVDLEVRSVETDLGVLDILGGAVEVVDKERSGDGGHVDQGTRMA